MLLCVFAGLRMRSYCYYIIKGCFIYVLAILNKVRFLMENEKSNENIHVNTLSSCVFFLMFEYFIV